MSSYYNSGDIVIHRGHLSFDHTGLGARTKGTAYNILHAQFKNSANGATYGTNIIDYIGTDGTDSNNTCIRLGSASGTTWITAGEGGPYMPNKVAYNDENLYLSADADICMYTSTANDASSYNYAVLVSGTSLTTPNGNLIAGTDGNTGGERQVKVQSGAGAMYLSSQAATNGERGLCVPAHGSGTAYSIVAVDTNNVSKINANYIGVRNTSATTGYGVSLYDGPVNGAPTYGIMFAGTATYGTHGGVTSDWATYLTMSDTTNRGWIFRRGSTNVASIDGNGQTTLNGGLEIKGHIAGDTGTSGHGAYSGGGYHSSYNNIILHGDSTTGTSGLLFISDKGTTNINQYSDRAFIQWHAHGVTTYTAEGTAPTLATSGEANILVIGVGNDATDQVRLQTPSQTGLLHQMGANAYVIPDTGNTTGTVGGVNGPVYVNGGVITACTTYENAYVKGITPAGTTAQFWRGDNSWSNTLTGGIYGTMIWANQGTDNERQVGVSYNGGSLYLWGNASTGTAGLCDSKWGAILQRQKDNTTNANVYYATLGHISTATYTSGNTYNSSGSAIEIREVARVGSAQSAWTYAPKIGFHWSGRVAAQLGLDSSQYLCLYENNSTTPGKLKLNKLFTEQPADHRDGGIVGTYDSTKVAGIWAMGSSYQVKADGSGLGSLYGAAYGYESRACIGSVPYAKGHQFLWCQNGGVYVALGDHVWSRTTASSWLDGQRYNNAAYNVSDMTDTGSYWPWMRGTNTGSAKWFSLGVLNNSFYIMGSTTSRTENSYDYCWRFNVSNGYLYGNFSGYLSGNISGSSTSCTGNAATASQLYVTGSSGTQYLTGVPENSTKNQTQYIYSPCYMSGGNLYAYNLYATSGLIVTTANGATVYFGSQNTSYIHFVSNVGRPYYFDSSVYVNGTLYYYPNTAYYWNGSAGYSSTYYTNNWFRSYNDTGWFNESHGGGIWMNDNTYVRVYNGKYFIADRVYNAVWNDYAECRNVETEEPGRCVTETTSKKMALTTERLQAGCKFISDTFGTCIGETEWAKVPIAVSGRVLAYPYRAREEYKLGDAVCSAPNGMVDIMTRDEIMMYPERIVGTVSEIPDYEIWQAGSKENPSPIQVNGRIWIYVR